MTFELIEGRAPGWRPADTFGTRLRQTRRDLGLSADDMADLCDYSRATLSSWERGARPHNLLEVVERVVAATKVDRDWLLWGVVSLDPEDGQKRKVLNLDDIFHSDVA